jgi:hypothetical protein
MFTVRQSSDIRHQSQEGMSVQGSKRVGAQDSRYAAMSALYTQQSVVQDTKLESGEKQGPSS